VGGPLFPREVENKIMNISDQASRIETIIKQPELVQELKCSALSKVQYIHYKTQENKSLLMENDKISLTI
jgi:hypothetical protein